MRIAVITNHADDIYCFRKELIESFIPGGHEIIISCPPGDKLDLLKDLHFTYDQAFIDRRGTSITADLKLMLHYYKMLKKLKPDIVLTYTIKPNIYASIVCSWLKIRYLNNITGLGSVLTSKGMLKFIIMRLLKLALRKSSCVFFQNKENLDLAVKNKLVGMHYTLIPGSGVNPDRFPAIPYPEISEKIVFNYIGRVLNEKGVDDYIEAAERIKSKYPDTEFNIIGFVEPTENHYIRDLEELGQKGIVIYRGNQQDVRPFIARSHCTIHPSKYGEGISNVLLESASSARPVITTDTTGCRDTVDDRVSGYIYRAGDVANLVERIEEFLQLDNDKRRAMGLSGRAKVVREFNRQTVIDAYHEQIKNLI